MSDYGRHRRVYSLEWLEASFQSLTDAERVLYFYLRTGPQSTSAGCYRISAAVAVEELGNLTPEEFEQRLTIVCSAFGWRYDASVRVLWIPDWLEQNPPQSPNVVTSWRKLLGNVPDCVVKAEAVDAIHRGLKELPEAFRKAFGNYRVSLPEAHENSKAQPKAQASSHQGSGIRDQRSFREQGAGALRAMAAKKNKDTFPEPNARLLKIAREVISDSPRDTTTDYLVDHFQAVCRQHQIEVTRTMALAALAKTQEGRSA